MARYTGEFSLDTETERTCKMRGAGRGEVGKSIVRGKLRGRTPQFRCTKTH